MASTLCSCLDSLHVKTKFYNLKNYQKEKTSPIFAAFVRCLYAAPWFGGNCHLQTFLSDKDLWHEFFPPSARATNPKRRAEDSVSRWSTEEARALFTLEVKGVSGTSLTWSEVPGVSGTSLTWSGGGRRQSNRRPGDSRGVLGETFDIQITKNLWNSLYLVIHPIVSDLCATCSTRLGPESFLAYKAEQKQCQRNCHTVLSRQTQNWCY